MGCASRAAETGLAENVNLTDKDQDRIDAEAADWAARLGGEPLCQDEREALNRWLEDSPAHRAAFEEAQLAWRMMGALPVQSDIDAAELRPPRFEARKSRLPQWPPLANLAACFILAFGLGWIVLGDPVQRVMADHRTASGERKSITLADGSVLELGPESAVDIRFDADERRVVLMSGLAYFAPAPQYADEPRPFIVESRNGSARALGTEFMVRTRPRSVEVMVVEHSVEVALDRRAGKTQSVILQPGRSVRYSEAGLGLVDVARLDQGLAWRRDRLIVDNATLSEMIFELNRYRHAPIIITSDALASRRVSGVFDPNRSEDVIDALTRDLGVRSASIPAIGILLY